MSALEVFHYADVEVRTVIIDGEPWFVLADLCDALGISRYRTDRLDGDWIRNHSIADRSGRSQLLNIVSEQGMYEVVIRSDKPEAVSFRRWITGEVLPSIRRTGNYAVPESREKLIARAVLEASAVIAEAQQQIEALTPSAEAWDAIASADGDYAVADAAKMLARAGVETGPQRLFGQLDGMGWIFRGRDGAWRAYSSAVDAGYLAEKPQSHHHPRTGEVVLDPPQVRVTLRGVERLRIRLGALVAI